MTPSSPALWMFLMCCFLFGQLAMIGRLAASGLVRQYPAFTLWSLVYAIKAAVLLYVAHGHGFNSPAYVSAWLPLEVITVTCLVFVGLEVYHLTGKNYPSLGNFGRQTLLIAAPIGLSLAILPFFIEGAGYFWGRPTWVVAILSRTATMAVGASLIIGIRRLRFVPIPEQKNLKNHRKLIVLYCAGQAVGLGMLVATHGKGWIALHLLVTAICWLVWPFAVTRAGEELNRRTYTDEEKAEVEKRWSEIKLLLEHLPGTVSTRRNAARQ